MQEDTRLITPSVMLYCAHGPKVSKKINHGTLFDHFPNKILDFKVIHTNRLIEEPQNKYFSIEFPLRFAKIAIFRGILFSNFRVDISTTVTQTNKQTAAAVVVGIMPFT